MTNTVPSLEALHALQARVQARQMLDHSMTPEQRAAAEERQRAEDAARRRAVTREAQDRIAHLIGRDPGPPRRFLLTGHKLVVDDTNREAYATAKAFLESLAADTSGRWLWIYGEPGVGKSTLAARAAIRVIRDAERTVLWATAPQAHEDLRRRDLRAECYRQADLLILDDFGLEAGGEWEEALLFDLLARRYDDCRAAFLVSNGEPFGVLRRFGSKFRAASLNDRLREIGTIAHITGQSRRRPT